MLKNFSKIKLASEAPYILLSKSGLTFNRDAIMLIGRPEWVDVLRNPDTKEIAVVPVSVENKDEDSFAFYNESKKNSNVVRWTNRRLIRMIEKDMNWDSTINSYKITGEFDESENAMIFDLKNAITII